MLSNGLEPRFGHNGDCSAIIPKSFRRADTLLFPKEPHFIQAFTGLGRGTGRVMNGILGRPLANCLAMSDNGIMVEPMRPCVRLF